MARISHKQIVILREAADILRKYRSSLTDEERRISEEFSKQVLKIEAGVDKDLKSDLERKWKKLSDPEVYEEHKRKSRERMREYRKKKKEKDGNEEL